MGAVPLPSASEQLAIAPTKARGPSDALARAWPIETPEWIAYGEWRGFSQTQLFAGLQPAFTSVATPVLDADRLACFRDWISTAREWALGGRANDTALVVRFDTPPRFGDCMHGATSISIEGAKEAYQLDHAVIATSIDGRFIVYATTEALVTRALHPASSPSALAALRLGDDEYVELRDESATSRTRLTVRASDGHFAVHTSSDFHDTDAADAFEKLARTSPDEIRKAFAPYAKPSELERIMHLASVVRVTRERDRVDIAFDLREPPNAQITDINAVATMMAAGVSKYLIATKQAEAYSTLDTIGRDIVTDWERAPLVPVPFAKKKLRSFPAVPKTVPRGVKYQSSQDDWKAWSPLRFSMTQPQFFQYEVRAAKDGESAEIIAHGDLNGDGKTSTFSLAINVDRRAKVLRVAAAPTATDPEE